MPDLAWELRLDVGDRADWIAVHSQPEQPRIQYIVGPLRALERRVRWQLGSKTGRER